MPTHVVTMSGAVDLVSAPAIAEDVHDVLEAGPGSVVLDLRAVDFLDSCALRLVRDLAAHAERRGVPLSILPAVTRVHEPFVLTGLDPQLPFVRDVAPA